jgi:RNA polymerase sigma factor (sigma-70 family)
VSETSPGLKSGAPAGQESWAELYREYLPRILNYIRLRVGSEDLAQDLTAAVFERAVAKQHTLRKHQAFGAWLFRIARNVVAGHYRRRRPTVPLEWVDEPHAGGPSPPEVVMRREELERLWAALGALSDREQEIIHLRFGAALGNKEIAEIVRLRPGHVAVIVYRALRKLRVQLGEGESPGKAQDGEG